MLSREHLRSAALRAHESDLRAARRNPFTRLVIAHKTELRRRIDADAQLKKDFEFLISKTGWDPHTLLHQLYWDSNMMHADSQTLVRKGKNDTWPIDRKTLEVILKNIARLAEQVEEVSKTEFSPARAIVLRNRKGLRLHPKYERYLLETFSCLHNVLRYYGAELKRNLDRTCVSWEREKERWNYLVDVARRNSLYEGIRLATPGNQYHATRLLRLVNTSRNLQNLLPIEHRAFIVWLNRLKRRSSTPPVAPPFQLHQLQRAVEPEKDHI